MVKWGINSKQYFSSFPVELYPSLNSIKYTTRGIIKPVKKKWNQKALYVVHIIYVHINIRICKYCTMCAKLSLLYVLQEPFCLHNGFCYSEDSIGMAFYFIPLNFKYWVCVYMRGTRYITPSHEVAKIEQTYFHCFATQCSSRSMHFLYFMGREEIPEKWNLWIIPQIILNKNLYFHSHLRNELHTSVSSSFRTESTH